MFNIILLLSLWTGIGTFHESSFYYARTLSGRSNNEENQLLPTIIIVDKTENEKLIKNDDYDNSGSGGSSGGIGSGGSGVDENRSAIRITSTGIKNSFR